MLAVVADVVLLLAPPAAERPPTTASSDDDRRDERRGPPARGSGAAGAARSAAPRVDAVVARAADDRLELAGVASGPRRPRPAARRRSAAAPTSIGPMRRPRSWASPRLVDDVGDEQVTLSVLPASRSARTSSTAA